MTKNCFILLLMLMPINILANLHYANDYGAKGDGKTLDTKSIQKAIDAASAAGGGTVGFKNGTYLTGAIFLKSNTKLWVDIGVKIIGSQNLTDFPIMPTRIAGVELEWPSALITVYEQHDVTIYGNGVIDGDGKIWWDKYRGLINDYNAKGLRGVVDYDIQRVRLIQLFKSSHINLEQLNLQRSGFWTVHICYSDTVTVDGITIRNNIDGKGISTDGIDIDSSSNILVQHVDIEANDDAIVLKAGRDADGLRVNKPTRDVIIRDSVIRAGEAGVTFGSETSGGFYNVTVYGLDVHKPVTCGVFFKSAVTRGGGGHDIKIHDLDLDGVLVPIRINFNWNPAYSYVTIPDNITDYPAFWDILAQKVPEEEGIPHFSNVTLYNIYARGTKTAFMVEANKAAPALNFDFKNISIEANTAGSIQYAENWNFENVIISTHDNSSVKVIDSKNITGLSHN